MSQDILDELFQKIADAFNLSFAHDKQKYLTYLFNIADKFSQKGIYGTTIEQGLSAKTPGRAIIRRKISTITPLFSLVTNTARTLCENKLFKSIENLEIITSNDIDLFAEKFECLLNKRWSFICVGFLGHLFNQEVESKAELNKFYEQWLIIIRKIAYPHWKTDAATHYVANTSITYITGTLADIQRSNSRAIGINKLCNQLKKYWSKQSLSLPEIRYE